MEKRLADVYFGLGSNLGDKEENLHQAIKNMKERIGELITYSAFFETDPVGFSSENQFVNAACHFQTSLSPVEILEITHQIEIDMGRNSKSSNKAYADRVIDIDMLLYGEQIINLPNLTLPHPHLHERAFVLHPLAEIAGDFVHPVLNKTILQLEEDLD